MMFQVTETAHQYILSKGGQIKVYLENYHSAGG